MPKASTLATSSPDTVAALRDVLGVDIIELAQTSGMIGYADKATMDADLAHDAGALARVTNDATEANNGAYRKEGASGAGSWVQADDRVVQLKADLADTAGAALIGFGGGTVSDALSNQRRDTTVTITVGTGGDYATLNAAIAAASVYRAKYVSEGLAITIRILDDGWQMAEQVIANNGIDLGFIEIVSDQASVTIVRSAITETTATVAGFDNTETLSGAFMAANGAVLPRIGCVFAMDASGSVTGSGQSGIILVRGATAYVKPSCGINDCAGLGAHVIYGSTLIASGSVWTGNGTSLDTFYAGGIRGDWVSFLNLQEANIHDNPGQGVMVNGASLCSVRDADIVDNGMDGLQTGGCSPVHARGATITGNGGRGIYASEGSSVRLLSTTITGNTGTGVQIDTGARVNSATGTVISTNGGHGVRCGSGGLFVASAPTIQTNTSNGCYADGGNIHLVGGTVSGHAAGTDLVVNGGDIRLEGTVTTSSGTSAANNVTDSNVACLNAPTASGLGGIYGRGGKAHNRGTATVASGSTSIAVSHGLGFTPLIGEISVTRTNSGGSSTKFWISSVTGTQFTINVDVAPGSGGATFGWNVQRIPL